MKEVYSLFILLAISSIILARNTPNITLPNSFEIQLVSQDFGFPNIVDVRIDSYNDRIMLNSTLDISPFDPIQMLAFSLDVNTRKLSLNLDQTCKKLAIPQNYFYKFNLSTFFTLYEQLAEYKGIVQKKVQGGNSLENFHLYQIKGQDIWSKNKVDGILRAYYKDIPGTPLFEIDIDYKSQLFVYRVSKEILEREYTLEDFEFKGCESITIMEYYKIYEIYSTLNELIKELYEKYKDSF